MKIILSKEEGISFTLQSKGLAEAIENCNLGSGTIYNPINVDGFVTSDHNDLPTFFPGKVLELKIIDPADSPLSFKLTSAIMENVGKVFNQGTEYTTNQWGKIFDIKDKAQIQSLPNGSLSMAPIDGTISISVLADSQSPPDELHYIAYNIVFESNVDDRTMYFIIDPLLKISSNPPLT